MQLQRSEDLWDVQYIYIAVLAACVLSRRNLRLARFLPQVRSAIHLKNSQETVMSFIGPAASNVSGPQFDYYGYEVRKNGWNTPPEYLSYVDDHWLKYDAPNPMLHHLLGVLYIGFTVMSLCGNGVVIWVFLGTKGLKTPSNMLVVHLAIADFIMMLKTPTFVVNSFNEGPVMGRLGCSIYGFMGALSGPMNACTNAAIAFDRYKTITDPIDGRLTKGQVTGIILFIWLWISPWVWMPFLEIWNRFVPEGYLTSCTFDYMSEGTKFFVVGIWFCMWLCPLLIILVSYYQVFAHVSKHEKALKRQAEKMNVESLRSGDKVNMRQEIRVAKVGITCTALYLMSWTPYVTLAFICTFGRKELVTPFMSMIPACTSKTAACIDPFIYAINHPKYRIALKKKLPWFCVHESEPSAASETESKSQQNA
ncbi:opsin, ultraviolet-sensitive-like [Macrobrachium rosenbergii]|uniref:opsin, ultraviolet-sensitive-like n=1 Tax=Macrobrachium rosenbergii TaxID=79674 RepID=UPI0034D4475D